MLVAVHRLEKCLLFDIPLYLCNFQWNSVMVSLVTYWACHVLYPALVSNNSFKHSPCCVNYLRLSQWTKGKKRKESSLFDFPRRILSRIVSLLQCVAGSARWNPCQPCHLIPGQPQNPSELYEHKAVMNLSPPVILSGAAGSLSSQSGAVAASCAQPGFPFCSLSPKTKRVVSMLSENYSVQDVSPFISSYVESHFSS